MQQSKKKQLGLIRKNSKQAIEGGTQATKGNPTILIHQPGSKSIVDTRENNGNLDNGYASKFQSWGNRNSSNYDTLNSNKIGERTMESLEKYKNSYKGAQYRLPNYEMQIIKETDRQKQRRSQIESQLLHKSPRTQRLNTDELVPSFRQNYEKYQLLQQLADHKRTIQLKNKQIFYFSTHIVSIKDQFAQKIMQLQAVIAENKRQLTQLRYNGLKNKKMQCEKGDKLIQQVRKGYQLQIQSTKQTHTQYIKKLQQQHKCQMSALTQKYTGLLSLQQSQQTSTSQIHNKKCESYQQIISQLQTENSRLAKQREEEGAQYEELQLAAERLKEQFRQFSEKAILQERDMRIQIQKLRAEIDRVSADNDKLRKNIREKQDQHTLQIRELNESVGMHKDDMKKTKQLIKQKDKQIQKLVQLNIQKSLKSHRVDQKPPQSRACRHEGLISQLQRNIQILNKQNEQLKAQLQQWGTYIGFQRSLEDRTSQLLNLSQEALSVQRDFGAGIRARSGRFKS